MAVVTAPYDDRDVPVTLNPSGQYATEGNLRARQRFWEHQRPPFDLVAWVLSLAGFPGGADSTALDVGCGNGIYLRELARRGARAVGCDLSLGMLGAVSTSLPLVNADVAQLPFPPCAFDVVLAPHMLYHVDDRRAAALELRRVLKPHGRCVVVTNGQGHLRALCSLVEGAVKVETAGFKMHAFADAFSLENGASQLAEAFASVELVRPAASGVVRIRDAEITADYVASLADHYQPQTTLPWEVIVGHVRAAVQRRLDEDGEFVVAGDTGAFICS